MEELGKIIKDARKNAGLSQNALAKQCAMSRACITDIESSKTSRPSIKTLKILANQLNLDFFELTSIAGYVFEKENDNLASLIKNSRMKMGISQYELAILCDMNQQNLSYIESGKIQKPRKKTLEILAQELNLDLILLEKLSGYSSEILE